MEAILSPDPAVATTDTPHDPHNTTHQLQQDADTTETASPRTAAAKNACKRCHDRKVKCDIASTGRPCSGCTKDSVACELRSRKSYAPRKRRRNLDDTDLNNPSLGQPYPLINVNNAAYRDQPANSLQQDTDPALNHLVQSAAERRDRDGASQLPYGAHRQGIGYILDAAALDAAAAGPQTLPNLFFKNQMAQYDDDYIFYNPSFFANHFQSLVEPDELAFLNVKGIFNLPPPSVCDELIIGYFRFIHPTMPVLDSAEFIPTYERLGIQGSNLLLLWSIFYAGASYISEAGLAQTGHRLRKDLKLEYYTKAKTMSTYITELDSTVVVQHGLLLGMWLHHSDVRSRAKNWAMSLAIDAAQSVNLHRAQRDNGNLSPRRIRYLRRLWWICVCRDRWESFTNSRPMKIDLAYCDVSESIAQDLEDEDAELHPQTRARYGLSSDAGTDHYAHDWTRLMQLTSSLEQILSHNYKARTTPLSYAAIDKLDADIRAAVPVGHELSSALATNDAPALLRAHQLALYRDVALIALHRKSASHADSTAPTPQRLAARDALAAAAASADATMQRIVADDGGNLLPHLAPASLALVVPVMQTHLAEASRLGGQEGEDARARLNWWVSVLSECATSEPATESLLECFQQETGRGTGGESEGKGVFAAEDTWYVTDGSVGLNQERTPEV